MWNCGIGLYTQRITSVFTVFTSVFQNLQNKLTGIQNLPKFAVEAYKTNMLIWEWFMTSSMKAAIHLDARHTENLEVSKNSEFEDIESLSISQRN